MRVTVKIIRKPTPKRGLSLGVSIHYKPKRKKQRR